MDVAPRLAVHGVDLVQPLEQPRVERVTVGAEGSGVVRVVRHVAEVLLRPQVEQPHRLAAGPLRVVDDDRPRARRVQLEHGVPVGGDLVQERVEEEDRVDRAHPGGHVGAAEVALDELEPAEAPRALSHPRRDGGVDEDGPLRSIALERVERVPAVDAPHAAEVGERAASETSERDVDELLPPRVEAGVGVLAANLADDRSEQRAEVGPLRDHAATVSGAPARLRWRSRLTTRRGRKLFAASESHRGDALAG